MNPGICNISNEEYHSSKGISRSGLMLFRKSPLHYWHRYINPLREPQKQTDAMVFGSALHTAILEPIEFEKRYAIKPVIDKMPEAVLLKDVGREAYDAYKRQYEIAKKKKDIAYAEFFSISQGKDIVSREDYEKILAMQAAVTANKNADDLIRGGHIEKSLYWEDSHTGVLCKARPDILYHNMIIDLKTTNDASYQGFQRSIVEYGYHLQAAFLREASRNVLPNEINNFIFLCVEKDAPHATAIYIIDEKSIDQGERELKKYLSLYKQCLDSNEWNSYNIQEISLPSWAFTNTEDTI